MKKLAFAALLLAAFAARAQIIDTPVGGDIPSGTAFPASPATGQLFTILDDSVAGACNSAAGTAQTLCRWTGAAWLPLGDGQAAGGTVAVADIDTSAELRTIVTDESGTGALLFAGGALGAATATSINGATITATTGGTLTLANSSTLVTSGANSITLTSTGATNVTLPTTGTLATTAGNVATATALAANPADCAANNFATTIAANGDLTCAQPSISAGVSGLAANVATFLGTPSSANLAAAVTDETGSGAAVFGTAPTIDSPVVTTKMNFPTVAAFPGTPASGDIVIVTDDSAAGACDSAAGSARSLCQYNGASWVSVGDGTAGGGGTAVTATSTFVTDNVVIRSDGTSRGVQNSGISINDTNDVSGVNDLAVGGNAAVTGTITASNLTPLSGGLTDGGAFYTDGTNIKSGAALTLNSVVLGGGAAGAGPKVSTGITSNGTAQLVLGVNTTTIGTVKMFGNTSGDVTVTPSAVAGTATVLTLPATTGTVALTAGNVATATALAADPADCSANNYATAIAASGALTCGQVSLTAGVTGTLPVANGGTGITAFGTGVGTALGQNVTGTGGIALATGPTLSGSIHTGYLRLPRVTAFPGTPAAGDVVIVTDDSTAGACDSAAGAVTSLCQYDGAAWVKLGDGTAAGGALSSADIDTSAEIRAIVTDESGTGALLFAGGDVGAATATTPSANDNDTSVATTAYVQTELTAYASDTATFTNKTFDSAGTGNVLKLTREIQLTHPDLVDGTGCTVGTTSTAIGYGRPACSNSADEAANYAEWYIAVPDDIDTGVAITAKVKFLLGGADTGTHRYVLSTVSVADSAVPTSSTLATAINCDFAGDGSGASGDVETVSCTLTGWAAALTAGQNWRIRLARDGNATEDGSTVNSTVLNVKLVHGVTQ